MAVNANTYQNSKATNVPDMFRKVVESMGGVKFIHEPPQKIVEFINERENSGTVFPLVALATGYAKNTDEFQNETVVLTFFVAVRSSDSWDSEKRYKKSYDKKIDLILDKFWKALRRSEYFGIQDGTKIPEHDRLDRQYAGANAQLALNAPIDVAQIENVNLLLI